MPGTNLGVLRGRESGPLLRCYLGLPGCLDDWHGGMRKLMDQRRPGIKIAIISLLLGGLAGCSQADPSRRNDPIREVDRPAANPDVLREIRSSTNCAELQTRFDRAANDNERYEPGSRLFKATLEYMQAADSRMQQIGCY